MTMKDKNPPAHATLVQDAMQASKANASNCVVAGVHVISLWSS